MEELKVTTFLQANADNLPAKSIFDLRERLLALDDSKSFSLIATPMKSPVLALVLGLLFGSLGADRLYIGDIGMGIGKLVTCGGLGIWAIVDWFLIMDATRQKNLQNLLLSL